MWKSVIGILPRGNTLNEADWQRRHRLLQWVLLAHVPALAAIGAALGNPPVPQTVMPSSRAASMSIEALPMPVVTSSFKSGSDASRSAVNGVRSRIATITSKSASMSRTTPSRSRWSWKYVISAAGFSDSHGPKPWAMP